MNPIKSFVVRIYRQDRRGVAGLVEDVRTGKSWYFQSLSGLWSALCSRRPAPLPPAAPATEEPTS